MYTIDASVWVNGFDQREVGHDESRRFLGEVGLRAIRVIIPTLALVEITGAVSRTRGDPQRAERLAASVSQLTNVALISLDVMLARVALRLAAQQALRGADAVYAAVALQSHCRLVTLDREQLARLQGVVPVETPTEALAWLHQNPRSP